MERNYSLFLHYTSQALIKQNCVCGCTKKFPYDIRQNELELEFLLLLIMVPKAKKT